MITFEELSEADGRIIAVSIYQRAYHVVFECSGWPVHDRLRRFEIVFSDVAEATLTPSASDGMQVAHEHPLLWQHNDEHVSMFFSSSPPQPLELLGALYEAHTRLLGHWREMGKYLYADSELLRGGHGLFARGPKRVIEEYAKVVGERLRHSLVRGHSSRGGYQVVLFDMCYVVCRSVSVIEQDDTA